ncbi:MAG: aldolase/citrate lyase family protein [Pseudomonadota bacterium]
MTGLDPTAPRLKHRLAAGEPVGAAWFTLGSVTLIEVACRHGPDAVVIDMQHGLFDRLGLEAAVAASTAPVLVRTRDDHAASIGEALDAGAEGVIVPLVENAVAAAAVAAACRYPPDGHRSGGGIRPLADFAAHVGHATKGVVAGVMIETEAGVKNAAAIAKSGVDFVFIGTGDLALSLGVAPGSKAHEAACQKVLSACRRAKVPCGVFALSAEAAVARSAQGFALTVATIDLGAFEDATKAALDTFRTAALTPEPPAKKAARRPVRRSSR